MNIVAEIGRPARGEGPRKIFEDFLVDQGASSLLSDWHSLKPSYEEAYKAVRPGALISGLKLKLSGWQN